MRLLKSTNSHHVMAFMPEGDSFNNFSLQVIISDNQAVRSELVARIAAEGGVQLVRTADLSTLNELKLSTPFCCALVALDECPALDSPVLDLVRAMVRKGVLVVCYADRAQTWALAKRCNVLLSGAFILFDSSEAKFELELKQTMVELLQWATVRVDEQERIKREMRQVGIVGESKAMCSIFDWIKRVSALSDLPALITGETGTGKELIVKAIYQLDPKRSLGQFVVVNCAAIGAGVAESELFGHCRGAFTGAERNRKGLIRAANGGVLFLDEIGDLEFGLQAKLLRVLQEGQVLSVGEDQEVPIDIRVIAATNRNLEEMVQNGTFRADLYHRLNILSIEIPPLRLRRADLEPMVKYFAEKHGGLACVRPVQIDSEFIEALSRLKLLGNARELENLVRRVLVNKSNGGPLLLSHLPPEILAEIAESRVEEEIQTDRAIRDESGDLDAWLPQLLRVNDGNLTRTLEYCERVLIASALENSNGNRSEVAKQLGITSRSVYNKLRKYRLG